MTPDATSAPQVRAPFVLRGRTVVPGVVEGEALVSHETISGWGGIDPATGTIIERRHELHGVCFTGKILVFPGAKGSSGWSGFFQTTRLLGTAPIGMIFTVTTTKAALGAVVTRVPAVTDLDRDPVTVIRTGDHVRIDAGRGIVEVTPAS
jgi:predicted aconitase with swiveling domain